MKKNIFLSVIRIIAISSAVIILLSLLLIGPGIVLAKIAGIIVAAALLSIIMAWMAAKKIARPVAETADIVRKIARQGNYPDQTGEAKNEAEQLAIGVNSLAVLLDKAVEDLSDSNSSLKAMLKAIPSAVIAVDKDKKIIMTNSMAKNLFDMEEESEGKNFIDCVRNVSLEKLLEISIATKKKVEDERPILTMESESIYKINIAPIKKENKVIGAVLLAQDITDIRHLEMMRRDFAANVSHELKTPLTVIKGFLETIKTEKNLNESTREKFLDIISVETDRLSRLIEDILTLSEIETGNLSHQENINVDTCIQKSVEFLTGKAKEKNINLQANLHCGGFVLGSQDRVSQMAINLIENAIKYTQEGGFVLVGSEKTKENCIITVEDNGIGISIEDQRRLFERFYRADKSRSRALGGTGLGLSIVKHIATSMGGSVMVKSAPGKGSVFTVLLPLA